MKSNIYVNKYPCTECNTGWATASEKGIVSCRDSCTKFAQYEIECAKDTLSSASKESLIEAILNRPDSTEIICRLMDRQSSQSYEDGKEFISMLEKISNNMIVALQKESLKYAEAAN